MKFKEKQMELDWETNKVSQKLKNIIVLGNEYALLELGKELTITDLIRTQAEQDFIYRNNPKYKVKSWQSVHQAGRGADLRVRGFSPKEIEKLKSFFNCFTYDISRPDKKTCTVHDVGSGNHFHVQSLT